MSLEETKQLLRIYKIAPNRLLGQNFMVESTLYPKLCMYASIDASDVVLDAGAGFGFLTSFLASKCKQVIAVEKDLQVANVLRERVMAISNVKVIEGDVLKMELPTFNKVVSIPPYYLSSDFINWLLDCKIDRAVLILQREFVNRLTASVGSEEYGWLTVLTYQEADVEVLDEVPASNFFPQPEVDSVILRLIPWSTKPFEIKDRAFFRQIVKWLFTQRNKKLRKALVFYLKNTLKISKQEAEKRSLQFSFRDKRTRDLSAEEFGAIANAIKSN